MTPSNQSERIRIDQSVQYAHDTDAKRTTASKHEDEIGSDASHERETCPECDGQLVPDPEHGETACGECGLVVETDTIDSGPDWRAFNS